MTPEELEALLKNLLKMGYRPKGRAVENVRYEEEYSIREGKSIFYYDCGDGDGFYVDLRRLVSIESGLWQFCMENGLISNIDKYGELFCDNESENKVIGYDHSYHEYRLLESALIPEE